MQRDHQRLLDIVQAVDTIEGYLADSTRETFFTAGMLQDAVLRQLMIVGEAVYKVTPQFQQQNPQMPWPKIIGFRHRLIHDYAGLDLEVVWKIAHEELPLLKLEVLALLRGFPAQE